MKSGQVNWIEMQCECDASRQPARLNTAQYRVGHSYRCRIHIYTVRNPSAVTIYAMLLWFQCVDFLILYSIEAIRVYLHMNSLNIGRGLVSLTLYTYRLPMYLLCVCTRNAFKKNCIFHFQIHCMPFWLVLWCVVWQWWASQFILYRSILLTPVLIHVCRQWSHPFASISVVEQIIIWPTAFTAVGLHRNRTHITLSGGNRTISRSKDRRESRSTFALAHVIQPDFCWFFQDNNINIHIKFFAPVFWPHPTNIHFDGRVSFNLLSAFLSLHIFFSFSFQSQVVNVLFESSDNFFFKCSNSRSVSFNRKPATKCIRQISFYRLKLDSIARAVPVSSSNMNRISVHRIEQFFPPVIHFFFNYIPIFFPQFFFSFLQTSFSSVLA